MKHSDFRIGLEFTMSDARWRCTDVGTRTVIAIKLDHPEDPSWYRGPPYAVLESVLDDTDLIACEPVDPAERTERTEHDERPWYRGPLAVHFAIVEGKMQQLGVESVHLRGKLVTVTTRQTEAGHEHGEGVTLLKALADLEDLERRLRGRQP